MKKKNLEKAIILGLILSTGIYGTAWAEDYSETNSPYNTSITDSDNTVTGDVKFELADKAWLTNNGGTVTVDGSATNGSLTVTTSGNKIIDSNGGTNTITMQGGISLDVDNTTDLNAFGLYNEFGNIRLKSTNGGDIKINVTVSNEKLNVYEDTAAIYNANVLDQTQIDKDNNITIITDGAVEIKAIHEDGKNNHSIHGIYSNLTSPNIDSNNSVTTDITAEHINIEAMGVRNYAQAIFVENAAGVMMPPWVMQEGTLSGTNTVKLTGTGTTNNTIKSNGEAIIIQNNSDAIASVEIISKQATNELYTDYETINIANGIVKLTAENGNNLITSTGNSGIRASESNVVLLAKNNIISSKYTALDISTNDLVYDPGIEKVTVLTALEGNNELSAEERSAIYIDGIGSSEDNAKVILNTQKGNNIIKGYTSGRDTNRDYEAISVKDGELTVTAKSDINNLNSGINEIQAGNVYDAIKINGSQNKSLVSLVTFEADTANKFYGSVYAQNKSVVDISAKDNEIYSAKTLNKEHVYAIIADGNKLTDDDRTKVNITANGGTNKITSTGSKKDERIVFATEGGVVNIEGSSIITANGWVKANESGYQANSTSQALIAGTHDWGNTTPDFDVADEERSEINLIYGNGSAITGDIAAGYAGAINIIDQSSGGGAVGISTMAEGQDTSAAGNSLMIKGNALAANGGKINLELGKGSVWQGRADDYQDAADENWAQAHLGEFNAVFSNDVQAEGAVNVALNDGATWDVMGQSWLTKLGGNDGVIDMRNTEGDDSRTSHAVHIGDLEGNHTFVMDLDTEHSVSDMLFIKGQASGEQKLWINSINGLDNLDDGDRLRFATVNSAGLTFSGDYDFGSYENAKNGIMLTDNGVMDNAFVIKNEEYSTADSENADYNGGAEFDEVKPGDEYVDYNYANGINWYLEREKAADKVSDAGKTIINMSKVNYSNAIYMDRLNKRLGEARYISPEDEQGMWVRIRHDRIGKDDAFRSQNTMYEMGYDVKQEIENGERRIGMAIDYMDGKAEYSGIAGDGDVKRYGLWLYDTWLGDKGHYTDYVLKWGHLENDFDIMARTTGEKITGDYSNNVFSASAEYGKKNDMGNGWYFEPQAQLQFARVTGADYTTSQDTKVSLDGINSLIGRAGFRLGRDLNENSTVYFKADLLHEFLGDQDITATDITGTLREEYENEGTWYDIGFGFATALGNNSYAFMDFEKSFGNDNDETYQINAGVRWTF